MNETTTGPISVIDLDGNFWKLVGVSVRKSTCSYGYFLYFHVLGNERLDVGYGGLDSKEITKIRDAIISLLVLVSTAEVLDLRKHFERVSVMGYCGCNWRMREQEAVPERSAVGTS